MRKLNLPSGWTHRHYTSVASTMLCCDPSTLEPGRFLLVTADEQTAGRGQRGTHWESAKGENLTFNVGWRPLSTAPRSDSLQSPLKAGGTAPESLHWPAANEQFLISEVTSLAVLRAIDDILSKASSTTANAGRDRGAIKWPNDVYIGDRKICGMLLEHQLSGRHITASIAGIGINVNQRSFATLEGREEGRGAPISLRQLLGHEVEREAVLERFVQHFSDGIALLQAGRYADIEDAFNARLYRHTGAHRYRDAEGEFEAEFVSIARNGIVTLRKDDGRLCSYAFKELAYII